MLEWATGELRAAGIEEARFEAQLLLALTLGVSRSSVIARTYAPLEEEQRQRFADLVAQRARRVPFAYLRGTQEFYGREFVVTPAVLVPRPETELLVEKVSALIENNLTGYGGVTVADVGTGSGCIVVSILAEQPTAHGVAFDISLDALKVAETNAYNNGVSERVRLVRGDLLAGAAEAALDIVVSNPPYIPTAVIEGLQAEVKEYEPRLALDGGEDGLHIYRRLVADAKRVLKMSGWLFMEMGQGQAGDVSGLMRRAGYERIELFRDLAGIERVVCGQKPSEETQ